MVIMFTFYKCSKINRVSKRKHDFYCSVFNQRIKMPLQESAIALYQSQRQNKPGTSINGGDNTNALSGRNRLGSKT